MANKNITVSYNEHRLAALEKVLQAQYKNIAGELMPELDSMYEKYVPVDIRNKVESLISREEAELRRSEGCFAVYHIHDDFDDYHFTDEFNKTFYDAAMRYREMSEYGYNAKTVDTVAHEYFPDHQPIGVSVFSVLCDTMPNYNRISALIEFDLENETVGVCDSSDSAWRVYNLEDVLDAVRKAELKPEDVFKTDREIFGEALKGKEIDLEDESQTAEPAMQV